MVSFSKSFFRCRFVRRRRRRSKRVRYRCVRRSNATIARCILQQKNCVLRVYNKIHTGFVCVRLPPRLPASPSPFRLSSVANKNVHKRFVSVDERTHKCKKIGDGGGDDRIVPSSSPPHRYDRIVVHRSPSLCVCVTPQTRKEYYNKRKMYTYRR